MHKTSKDYDYSSNGAYFITICTEGRRQILSRIVGVDVLGEPKNVELLPHGIVADKYIKQMNEFYENITVDQYVIMPNHIHFLLFVREDGSPRTSTPTKQTPTENLSGIIICLSVGAVCDRPRANTVRPYRVSGHCFDGDINLCILTG